MPARRRHEDLVAVFPRREQDGVDDRTVAFDARRHDVLLLVEFAPGQLRIRGGSVLGVGEEQAARLLRRPRGVVPILHHDAGVGVRRARPARRARRLAKSQADQTRQHRTRSDIIHRSKTLCVLQCLSTSKTTRRTIGCGTETTLGPHTYV